MIKRFNDLKLNEHFYSLFLKLYNAPWKIIYIVYRLYNSSTIYTALYL